MPKRRLIPIAGAFLSLLLAAGFGYWLGFNQSWHSSFAALIALLLSAGFLTLKGIQLHTATRFVGCGTTTFQATKLFCEGVLLQAFTWPGRVVADGYRIGLLSKESSKRSALSGIALFRGSSLVGQIIACLFACSVYISTTLTTVLITCFVLIAILAQFEIANKWLPERWRVGFQLIAFAMMASICDAIAFGSLAWILCGVDFLQVTAAYVLISNASTLSGLPLGIGVLDVSCITLLTTQFGIDKAIAFEIMLLYRATGPGLTITCGGACFATRWGKRRYLDWAKDQVDRSSNSLQNALRPKRQASLLSDSHRAFTLVELVIVVLVLGIMAAIAAPRFIDIKDDAYLSSAKALEKNLRTAALTYFQQHQSLPDSFNNWVAVTNDGGDQNLIQLASIRHNLLDTGEDIVQEDRIILNYKNGLVVVYTIDGSGNIEAEYSGTGFSGDTDSSIDSGSSEIN